MVDIKMYMSEISKFKISDLKPQKMTILWTLKHVSAISKHPVFIFHYLTIMNITSFIVKVSVVQTPDAG